MYSSSEPIDPSVLRLVQQKSLVRIVDDDETVAKSYEFMLRCSGWRCRIFNSAEDYLASENVQIGCLILDVRMPGLSGLQLQQKLEILEREIPIIFVTGHGDVDMAVQAMKDGAIDFIQKPINEERLLSAVAKAVRYDESHRGWTISAEEEKKRYQTLTAREKQILSLIAKGLINKEVSERLGLSPRTIEVHRQKGLHKLGVQTVSELVRLLSHIEENALS